jgi:membrane protease subunit HflC
MNLRNTFFVAVTVALVLLVMNSVYIIKEQERGLLLRFGAVSEADISPGMHFKLPIAEDVKKFDARILTVDSPPEQYYTVEKKPLIVDLFAKWRIVEVLKYYTATSGNEVRARQLLTERINEGMRNQFGVRDMHEVISGQRDQLMLELTAELNLIMQEDMGVEVIDVRVKKIELPPEVSSNVFTRMNSEREIEAKQYRATGEELALGIRADAERQVVVIEANAYREAEQIRGDGDAASARIYASAYGKDPEFYEFYRSINAYASVFQGKDDMLVIDPSSDFFKYLKNDEG